MSPHSIQTSPDRRLPVDRPWLTLGIITQIEYVQTDVYTRCLRYVFTLRSRLVTQMFTLRETQLCVGSCASSGLPRQRKRNLFTLMDSPAKGQAFTLKRLLVTFDVCVTVYVNTS